MVCVLSIEEAIGIPCRNARTSTLDAVACSSGIHSIRNAFLVLTPAIWAVYKWKRQKAALLKTKEFPHVNEEELCSSLLGMTCHTFTRCAAA